MPSLTSAYATHHPAQRRPEKPLPHADLAIQKNWQQLSADVPQRASQRPLPHENLEKGWKELSGEMPQGASQRPTQDQWLPHVSGQIQKGWEELSGDAPQRASQRPLPHANGHIQKMFDELSSDTGLGQHEPTVCPAVAKPNIGRFDEDAFRHFAPLLTASQEYARQSGFRFRSSSFDGLEEVATTLAQLSSTTLGTSNVAQALKQDASSGSRLAAKITAAPAIRNFRDRLAVGESALLEELEKAYRIVVAESGRNMMIATVKSVNLFPPSPAPQGVSSDDCSYEDCSAPLPMIAQRLYNDHVRRQANEGLQGMQQRRAMTAAFLVDFSHHAGVALPESPDYLTQEFTDRHHEFAGKEMARRRAAAELAEAEKAAELKARAAAASAAELQALWSSHNSPQNPTAAPEVPTKHSVTHTGWLQKINSFW